MPLSRAQVEIARALRPLGLRGATLVAALSGGADSVALVHTLQALSRRFGFRVVAAHLDHGLRAGSKADAAVCRRLCRSLGLPFRSRRADVSARARRDGGGVEDAARAERYAFLESVRAREDARFVVLAHTRDDQAETVLLRLLRGSGSLGLGAMRVQAGTLLRPMLRVSRQDVIAHLGAHGLSWSEDPTNADPAFVRNRVRLELIPYLEARFNPAIRDALARTAAVLADEADALLQLAAPLAARVATEGATSVLDRRAVASAPPAVARVAVRRAIRAAGGLRGVALEHVDAIVRLARRAATSGRRVALPGGRDAAIHFDEIRIGPADVPARPLDVPLDVPGRVELPDGRFVVARPGRGPGPDLVGVPDGPLTLRTRRPGDRVRSHGREMSLRRFLADRRVPAAQRDGLPVLACGHTVIWVEGQPVDALPEPRRHVHLRVTGPRA
jgi:tRNA(Ile)-lysidine synthase